MTWKNTFRELSLAKLQNNLDNILMNLLWKFHGYIVFHFKVRLNWALQVMMLGKYSTLRSFLLYLLCLHITCYNIYLICCLFIAIHTVSHSLLFQTRELPPFLPGVPRLFFFWSNLISKFPNAFIPSKFFIGMSFRKGKLLLAMW